MTQWFCLEPVHDVLVEELSLPVSCAPKKRLFLHNMKENSTLCSIAALSQQCCWCTANNIAQQHAAVVLFAPQQVPEKVRRQTKGFLCRKDGKAGRSATCWTLMGTAFMLHKQKGCTFLVSFAYLALHANAQIFIVNLQASVVSTVVGSTCSGQLRYACFFHDYCEDASMVGMARTVSLNAARILTIQQAQW